MFLNHFIRVIKEKYSSMNTHVFGYFSIQTFFQGVLLNHKKRKERMIYYEIF
jgi:hypothetical protein